MAHQIYGSALRWGAVVLPTALAVAGLIVAVEMPKIEKASTKWAVRLSLIIFGLITSAVVYFQQDYDRTEAAKAERIAIDSFKDSQSSGFNKVETDIKALPAPHIIVQPATIFVPKPPTQHAQIDITSWEYGKYKGDPSNLSYIINTHFLNKGQIHGDAPNNVFNLKISSSPLEPTQLSQEMKTVREITIKQGAPPYKKDRAQLEPSSIPAWVSAIEKLSPEEAALVESGKAWIYVFEGFTYRDPNTGHSYWVTEYCSGRQPDGTFSKCGVGNRTWLHP